MLQDYISLPLMLQMWLLVNLSFSIFDLSKTFSQKVVSVKYGNSCWKTTKTEACFLP